MPTTILSGVSIPFPVHMGGPFVDGNNNVYAVMVSADSAGNHLKVFKASNPTSSWTEQDTGNRPTSASQFRNVSAVSDGNVIHIVSPDNGTYKYYTFGMSPNGTADQWLSSNTSGPSYNTAAGWVQQVGRRSDGDILIAHEQSEKIHGTEYWRVQYSRLEVGSWTNNIAVSATGDQVDRSLNSAVRGGNDAFWIFFEHSTTVIRCRGISSANATIGSDTDNTVTLSSSAEPAPLAHSNGGTYGSTERIYMKWGSSTNVLQTCYVDGGGTHAWNATDLSAATVSNTSNRPIAAAYDTATDTHYLVGPNSSNQLVHDKSVAHAAWSSGGTISTSTPTEITARVINYGSGVKLGVVYGNGTNTVYDEVALGATVHNLTATGVATGAPTVANPTLAQVHVLTATGVATGAPTVGTPVLSEIVALTATGVDTAAPTVGTPTLGQAHTLAAGALDTGAPTVESPTIAQVHALASAELVTGAPTVDTPPLSQVHVLSAGAMDTGAPTVDNPNLAEVNDLTATGVDTGAPTVGTPALGQVHALTATGVDTAAPTVGTPTVGTIHNLTPEPAPGFQDNFDNYVDQADFIAGGWVQVISGAVFDATTKYAGAQSLQLDGNAKFKRAVGFSASPVWVTVYLYIETALPASNRTCLFLTSSSDFDNLALRVQSSGKLALINAASTLLGESANTLSTDLWYRIDIKATIADSINDGDVIVYVDGVEWLRLPAGTDTLWSGAANVNAVQLQGSSNLANDWHFDELNVSSALGIATGAPTVGTPSLTAPHELDATGIDTGAPTVGTPDLGQAHALASGELATGDPTVANPDLGQAHALSAGALDTGAPVVDQPTLGQTHVLTATGVDTGAPVLDTPTLGQTHQLTATDVATGAPAVDNPTLAEIYNLAAGELVTGAPTTDTADLGQVHVLSAGELVTGDPTVGTPSLTGAVDLTADSISTGDPTVGTPDLGQVHVLAAADLATGDPTVDQPTLTEVYGLTANGVDTGAPVLDQPTLGQLQVLVAVSVDTGDPVVDQPALGQAHALSAGELATGDPTVGTPDLGQIHVLATGVLETGAPVVDTPTLTEVGGGIDNLAADDIATGAPTVDSPAFGQVHVLAAGNLETAAPTVDSAALGQAHVLSAGPLDTAPPTVANPTLAVVHNLTGTGTDCGAPTVGTPTLGQVHVLAAGAVETADPTVGNPTLTQVGGGVDNLVATGIATGAPTVGSPLVTQVHHLVALVLSAGAPTVGSPGPKPSPPGKIARSGWLPTEARTRRPAERAQRHNPFNANS